MPNYLLLAGSHTDYTAVALPATALAGALGLGLPLSPLPLAALLMAALLLALLAAGTIRALRARPLTGAESMPGRQGQVRQDFTADDFQPPYRGQVFVSGELWRAQALEPLQRGEEVRVTAVRGITLQVEPLHKLSN